MQEDAASHRKLRHGLREKRAVGDLAERNAESFGDALQERAIARRALRVQAEIAHRAVLQDHDLDVHAADVADAIGIREIVQARGGVSDGLHHAAIRAQNALEQILAVAGDSEAKNLAVADGFAKLAEQASGVLDRIALAQRIAGEEQFLVRREAYGFRRGRAEIAAHHDAIQFFQFGAEASAVFRNRHFRGRSRPSWNTDR